MYKRKHKTVPYQLSLSSKKEKSAKPTNVCEVVVEINNENDSGTVNVSSILRQGDQVCVIFCVFPSRMSSRRLTPKP